MCQIISGINFLILIQSYPLLLHCTLMFYSVLCMCNGYITVEMILSLVPFTYTLLFYLGSGLKIKLRYIKCFDATVSSSIY